MTRSKVVSLAAMLLAASVLSIYSQPALAGGGSAVSGAQLLRRAALATALERSAHYSGTVALVDKSASQGFSFAVKAGATFSGDVSARGKPSFKIRGRFHFLSQSRSFAARVVGRTTAARTGKGPWQCNPTVPAPTGLPVTPGSLGSLKLLSHGDLAVVHRVKIVNLGASMLGNVPVWQVQLSLRTRLDLAPFIALAHSGLGSRHSIQSREVERLMKLPHPWVNARTNIWISQLNDTVSRVATVLRLRNSRTTLTLTVLTNLSRYGEIVHIHVPAKCMA